MDTSVCSVYCRLLCTMYLYVHVYSSIHFLSVFLCVLCMCMYIQAYIFYLSFFVYYVHVCIFKQICFICLSADYSCALQRDILVHGRLYITQNWLCFYANIFAWETLVSISNIHHPPGALFVLTFNIQCNNNNNRTMYYI